MVQPSSSPAVPGIALKPSHVPRLHCTGQPEWLSYPIPDPCAASIWHWQSLCGTAVLAEVTLVEPEPVPAEELPLLQTLAGARCLHSPGVQHQGTAALVSLCCLCPGMDVLCQNAALPWHRPGVPSTAQRVADWQQLAQCWCRLCVGAGCVLEGFSAVPLWSPALSSTVLPILSGSDGQPPAVRHSHQQQMRRWRRSACAGCHGALCPAGMSAGLWGPLPAPDDQGTPRCRCLGTAPGLFGEQAAAPGTARPGTRAAPSPRAESAPLRGGLW